ncbi:MAG: T9SS type A sorting domain-containing protein [Opitutaceae bacterium]|nr:T9SS type A sorting domain-containing protein [Cytophagales bacterium]
MKKISTLVAMVFSAQLINAQVVLNKANVPAIGTVIINYDANVPSPAFVFSKSGTNNNWDFTKVTAQPGQDDTINYVAPSTVPGGSNFPTADIVAYENGDKFFNFLKLETTGEYSLGLYGDVAGINKNYTIVFPRPVMFLPFPISASTKYKGSALVNKKVSGADAGVPVDSVWLWVKNYANVEVIASGNIIIPSGTFPAILARNITTTVDSSMAKFLGNWFFPRPPSTKTDSTFKWYTQESVEAYAHVIYKDGAVTDVTYHKTLIPTGLLDTKQNASHLICFPNPAREVINFDIDNESLSKITLISASGKEVAVSLSSKVDLNGFEPGIYLARVVLKNGQVRLSTFVKN